MIASEPVKHGECRYCHCELMSGGTYCIPCYDANWLWCPVCVLVRRDGIPTIRKKYNTGEPIGVCIECHGERGHLKGYQYRYMDRQEQSAPAQPHD